MNTRTGKIARLPLQLREELNCRLQDGEAGPPLVGWLNALEPVQQMLAEQFGGRAITEQNLSEWRQGGHQDWVRRQEARAMVQAMIEEAESLGDAAGGEAFTEKLALVLAAELAVQAQRMLAETTDPEARWEQLQVLLRELSRLRRDNRQAAQEAMRRQEWELRLAKGEQQAREKERLSTRPVSCGWTDLVVYYRKLRGMPPVAGTVISERPQGESGGQKSREIRPNPSKSDLAISDLRLPDEDLGKEPGTGGKEVKN